MRPLCDITLINEANLNRLMWHGRHGFIIISANRSSVDTPWNEEISLMPEYQKWCKENNMEANEKNKELFLQKRNKKALLDLKKDIESKNYAYTPVFGGYHPKEGNAKDSYEPSFVVYNHDRSHSNNYKDWKELKSFAIAMCNKYKQDSVYVQGPNEPPVYMNGKGEVVSSKSSDNFKLNRDNEEYFTTTKRDKTNPQKFTADIQFENMYRVTACATLRERMARSQVGEVFLDD